MTADPLRNWGGTVHYQAAHLHQPPSLQALRQLVAAADQVRVLGTRHTFNGLPDTSGTLISLEHLPGLPSLDEVQRTVRVPGGTRYTDLGVFLHSRGYALANLASLPHLNVVGACTTGTHGSGTRQPCLAASVRAMDLITADGTPVTVSRAEQGQQFGGMVVSLGTLGVVTQLTLEVEPTYAVRQDVYEGLSLAQATGHFQALMAAADSVSLFTTWQREQFQTVWLKTRVAPDESAPAPTHLYGAVRAEREHHPVWGTCAAPCTPQGGRPGPWHERWPHFRAGQTPSSGAEIQSEYLLPLRHAPAALEALFNLGARLAPLLYVSEVRTVAADSLWLSPASARDSVALHFTWHPREDEVRAALREVETALRPFQARPHWGKVFETTPGQLETLYPQLPDFRRLATEFDPGGKFRNAYLNRLIFQEPPS